jgi:hypothetical protein
MTHKDLEEIGWVTVATDTNSFVSKTPTEDVWLELFYCMEKNTIQIMRATLGEKGEVLRNTLHFGEHKNLDIIKTFYKK